jgi:hypothetical protein
MQAFTAIKVKPSQWLQWGAVGLVILLLAVGLAAVSSGFQNASSWLSYLAVEVLGAGIMILVWWLLRSEDLPRWLGALVIGAAFLRLIIGVLWFVAVPLAGHGSKAEQLGYVMSDASKRDQAAWRLASSNKSLFEAFRSNRSADQYGGMLFLSGLVYRYLGGADHQPLLIVVITAAISSLAVFFTWAFSRRAWGDKTAVLAAWALTIYPEAVLLGSSQMREAFTITLTIAAFYGLLRYHDKHSSVNLAWIIIPVLLCLPFSPPFTALLLGLLAIGGLALSSQTRDFSHSRWYWLAMAGLTLLVLAGLWFALSQFTPQGMVNPLEILSWWLRKSAAFQERLTRLASGWLQKIFKSTAEWTHIPILLGYGIVQPFLPAALIVGSQSPLWPLIAIWRSVGWTILLGFLLYAPILAFRPKQVSSFTRGLCLIIWLGVIIAAFRGGGDMWDNPRYRAVFCGLQISLASWAWLEHRRLADPWLLRALMGLGAVMAWFLPWYLRRYAGLNWPVTNLFVTLSLGLVSAALLISWDWWRIRARAAGKADVPGSTPDPSP